jgi:CRP/FNR family nitrogen fixation transcriptional regulator
MSDQMAYDLQSSAAVACGSQAPGLLAQLGVRMAFARNEEIYAQDEDADLIYQLVSGTVRTTRLMTDGRRQIGDFYYAGDVFGLEQGVTHRYSAEALSNAVVLVGKRSALRLAAGDLAIDRLISKAVACELERVQEHLLLLGRKTASEKVATFLLDAARRSAAPLVELPMGRQDMADYLGLTIETVSRMVTQLQGSGVVEFSCCRQFRVRDVAALRLLCE